MKREVKFSLVFRDMWQSAGKYVPRVDQLVKVAPAIIEMGCFARVETNGGGFEQVNLLFGENPNKAVREWTKPFHEAGIQTHMLDRALNGLRMSPVPADVRKLFYKVKKAQGTDITRTFCGLNDVRNIAPSITYAKEAGMISQCSLCITHSPIHTAGKSGSNQQRVHQTVFRADIQAEEVVHKFLNHAAHFHVGFHIDFGHLISGVFQHRLHTKQVSMACSPG